MNPLSKIRDSVAGYFSPAKRRRTVGPATPSNQTAEEHAFQPVPASEPQDKASYLSVFTRLGQKYLSPSDTKQFSGRKRPRDEDEDVDVDDVEDQENSGDEHETAQLRLADEEPTAEEKVLDYIDRQEMFAARRQAVAEANANADFDHAEAALFNRLAMRSFEPLIPAEWHPDFPTLPPVLYAREAEDEFINSNQPESIRAIRALQSVLTLGLRVKEQLDLGKPVDKMISKEIKNYMKWAETDGGYATRRFIPIWATVAARRSQDIATTAKTLNRQMAYLAEGQRDYLRIGGGTRVNDDGNVEMYRRHPPLIYGIIIAHARLIFVTLDSSNPKAEAKHIANFNMLERNMEVWNGFAIAILVVTIRNYMMTIIDELEEDEETEDDWHDPDA